MKKVIYILLMLIPPSCGKETYEYFYIPDSVKEWGLYQVGSYWIYEDEDTGQLDSVYVYDVKRTTEDKVSDKLHHRIYESFHVFFRNSNSETKVTYLENSYNGYSSVGNIKFKEHFNFYFRDLKTATYKVNNIIYAEVDSLIDESNNEIWIDKNNWIVKQKVHTDPLNFSTKTLIRNKIIK